ncbi:ArnT family glycosyltransferase [Candidatus Omnitrophota bacterium]
MKKITIDILFLLIIVAHIIVQIILLGDFSIDDMALATQLEQTKDSASHQENIQKMKRLIKEANKPLLMDMMYIDPIYPPLFYYTVMPIALFSFDKEYYAIRCGILLFSVLIFFLLYGYFRRKNNPLAGIWAVLFTACSPFFLRYSTATTPHMFMCLCVLFLFVLSEKTDSFRNWGWSLFFGIMSGVCLFAKNEMLIYCCVLYLVSSVPVIAKPTRRQISNLVMSLCLFGNFFVFFFYLYIYSDIIHGALMARLSGGVHSYIAHAGLFSFASFSFYGWALFKRLAGPYITIVLCAAIIVHVIKPHLRKKCNIIFLCVISLIIFTAILAKFPEYISPLIPLIAIICARGISAIRFRVVQSVIVVVVCSLTLNTYADLVVQDSLCARDTTQFEYGKIWDMLEDHITNDASKTIRIQVLGVFEGSDVHRYLELRKFQENYKNFDASSTLIMDYPEDAINALTSVSFCIYVSYSEKNTWPTQEEFSSVRRKLSREYRDFNPFHLEKMEESRNSFNEVARVPVTIHGIPLYAFLYENREQNKM